MARDVTPDSIRQARFRTVFRGADLAEVAELLEATAVKLEQIDAERRRLRNQLDQAPVKELESEFEAVGREVAAILETAREAAQSMRERASLDAARWRSEAMEEVDTTRKEAAADAEALRRDAWVTGTQLLQQAATASEAMRANAERDVLTVMGEAEREAHRLTSAARREAEDLVRNATMDAEKIAADAVSRRDEIIDGANRQAATAQERTRALEQRRDELMDELENVRSTLTRLETSLEERREALDLGGTEPSSSVKVVHPPSDAKKQWELGETVRVVPPDRDRDRDLSDPLDEVEPIGELEPEPAQEPEPERRPRPRLEPVPAPEPEAVEPKTAPPAEEEPAPSEEKRSVDDLSALFASLRGVDREYSDGPTIEPAGEAPEIEEIDEREDRPGTDWIEVRESRLLPITNRALRGVKKAMTEVQNVALDSLRTDETWRPDAETIAEAIHAEVVAVWTESFAAGHAVAEEMSGGKLRRPATPTSSADREFAIDLAQAVATAVDKAGEGPRERQSAASRVFRVWRSDEAERRIRDIALRGYETGIEESRQVSTNS